MEKFSEFREGEALIRAPVKKVVSKGMKVFYNPIMSLNRDIAVLLLGSVDNKRMIIADPLAGTGVRSIRFLKELTASKIKEIRTNDGNPLFPGQFKAQLKRNRISGKKAVIANKEASRFLLEGPGLDYIDIDPFGSPNPFLDSACKKVSRHGILAVTATDTGALAGSFPSACRRKYWAVPLKNEFMHETGLRILIRKIQLVAMQYEKALVPIFSHSNDHYSRVYFHVEKSKSYVDQIVLTHGYVLWCPKCLDRAVSENNFGICTCGEQFKAAGPLWLGGLWNHKLIQKMLASAEGKAKKLIEVIHNEAHVPIVGFYDIHRLCKSLGAIVPPKELIEKALKKKKYAFSATHFSEQGIRTDAPLAELKKIIRMSGQGV